MHAYIASNTTAIQTLTEESYRIGKSDLRDVMNRYLAANAADVALLAVRRERLVRRIDLHLALGGDFVAAAPATDGTR